MSFIRIRGEQIQLGVLKNEHVSATAAIAESKLNIDWAARHADALRTKKVTDTVQMDGVTVTAGVADLAIATPAAAAGGLGIVTGKNVTVRQAVSGEPLRDANSAEVTGTLTFVAADAGVPGSVDHYKLDLGVAFDGTVNILYVQRFDLYSVAENFAQNERYVNGAADVSTRLDLSQLEKDLGIALSRTGAMSLSKSLLTQLLDEVTRAKGEEARVEGLVTSEKTRAESAESTLTTNLATEVTNRTNADQAIRDDLASVAVDKGASKVGIQPITGITATTVQGALSEIKTAAGNGTEALKAELASVAATKGASLVGVEDAASKFTAATVEGVLAEIDGAYKAADAAAKNELAATVAGKGASLVGIEDVGAIFAATTVEGALAEVKGDSDATKSEVTSARGTVASLDARLDVAINENGTLKAGAKIHTHKKVVVQVDATLAGQSIVTVANAFQDDEALDVHVNGMLQVKGLHFTVGADLKSIDFSPEQLILADVVVISYVLNEAQ